MSELLPIRPRPYRGELLTSWIVRIAHDLGIKVETLCCLLFGRDHAIWARDADTFPSSTHLCTLAARTGVALEVVESLTLRSLAPHLTTDESSTHVPWVIPLGIHHRLRRRTGLMFCSRCLNGPRPHFKGEWRLAFVTVCIEHGLMLWDQCPECHAAIAPHRADIGPDGFRPEPGAMLMCWQCGSSLTHARRTPAPQTLVDFTRRLLTTAQAGYCHWQGNPSMYSNLIFQGLRRLASALCPGGRGFEFAQLLERRAAFAALADVFERGKPLVELLRERRLRYTDVLGGPASSIPLWLAREVEPLARHQSADRCKEEVAAALDALQNQTGRVSLSALRTRFGIEARSKDLPIEYRSETTYGSYEAFLMWVEQGYSKATSPQERIRVLKDKVLMILLRFSPWGPELLSATSAADIEREPTELPDTSNLPATASEARAWLRWHHWHLRPLIAGHETHLSEFLSPYTGKRLTANAIQARFAAAVRGSRMEASIPSARAYQCRVGRPDFNPL